jgi:hypothetical protein
VYPGRDVGRAKGLTEIKDQLHKGEIGEILAATHAGPNIQNNPGTGGKG